MYNIILFSLFRLWGIQNFSLYWWETVRGFFWSFSALDNKHWEHNTVQCTHTWVYLFIIFPFPRFQISTLLFGSVDVVVRLLLFDGSLLCELKHSQSLCFPSTLHEPQKLDKNWDSFWELQLCNVWVLKWGCRLVVTLISFYFTMGT